VIKSIVVTSTGINSSVQATALNTPQQKAQWISIAAPFGNTGFIAHGDSTVSASIGQQIGAGGGGGAPQYPPAAGLMSYGYMLSELYIYFEKAGDTAQINYLQR
jgi:hypothetical protein